MLAFIIPEPLTPPDEREPVEIEKAAWSFTSLPVQWQHLPLFCHIYRIRSSSNKRKEGKP